MHAIVVGGGGATRELLRRLGEAWDVTVIESSEKRLNEIEEAKGIRTVHGDGTSRLILQRTGLDEADAVVAASNDDEVNLEVCRLALEAGVLRVVAVAVDPERLSSYRQMGVTAFSPDSLVSRRVELTLEHRRYSSMAFAEGRAEAIEFHLGHDAPVVGKALKEFHADHWIIGAILRKEELIIPHGDTVLQEGDRVTVVGLGAHFPEIVRAFTSGEARFPLDFGKQAAVILEIEEDLSGPVAEAAHFVRNSAADSLVLVHRDPESVQNSDMASGITSLLERAADVTEGVEVRHLPVRSSLSRVFPDLCKRESIGILVLRAPRDGLILGKLRTHRIILLARRTNVPVLIARGTYPYKSIMVPARRTPSGLAAERAAIDLARYMGADVTGMAVVDPTFIAGTGTPWKARKDIGWLKQEAAIQQVTVRGKIQRGNPVRSFLEAGAAADLVVLGAGEGAGRRFGVAITTHIARRSPKSVLLVPVRE
jgi:Trk K+ transport system NAD-binding subunit/nucleotide-binding universal stress UspA family protein